MFVLFEGWFGNANAYDDWGELVSKDQGENRF